MSFTGLDVAHLLLAVSLLLACAHGLGHLFVLCRQPRVIGEIVGGLLLGPTFFGALWPHLQASVFPAEGTTAFWLGGTYQLGLMLLMFSSGAEMRSMVRRGEGRTVGIVTLTGVALPFAAGLALFSVVGSSGLIGHAGNRTSLFLVFALAIAVTSIPVISRIMMDLGIIDTSFARIVLGVAVVEDVLVYIVLALALGMVASTPGSNFGLPAVLGLQPGGQADLAFHVVATLLFVVFMLAIGGRGFRWSRHQRWNVLADSNPIAYHLLFLFGSTLLCVSLGITPLLGAILAGVAASVGLGPRAVEARAAIRAFSSAFFVPIYFALVGLQLDLLRHFDVVFFIWFLAFACAAKSASVYLGGRLSGESPHASRNLAVATNARGGPGIVLASVSYTAGIVSQNFYAALVMLAIVTSLISGSWLGRIVRRGEPLRDEPHPRQPSDRDAANA
jgi:Kef-type K+ transport system membrane component KefB